MGYIKQKINKRLQRTAVGAVYVQKDFIYYSCKEYHGRQEEFVLRKCHKEDGKLILSISGFHHIRGMGQNTDGHFYIVDSFRSRVLKFDKEWNPMQKTSNDIAPLFSEPNGILVDVKYVFVCSNKRRHICVLDHDLNLHYLLRLTFHPLDITKFQGKYFVTTESAIFIISDLNFQTKSFTETEFTSMIKASGELAYFKQSCELRGICASDQYLYATEKEESGRLLCFQFHNNQLRYMDEISNCAPNAIAYYDTTVYFSKGVYEKEFSIRKTGDKPPLTDTKLFDV